MATRKVREMNTYVIAHSVTQLASPTTDHVVARPTINVIARHVGTTHEALPFLNRRLGCGCGFGCRCGFVFLCPKMIIIFLQKKLTQVNRAE
jgi:hypothetical protein